MEIIIEKLAKKFNLNVLEETNIKKKYKVSEFSGINSIKNRKDKNIAAVILIETDISSQLNKINLIVVCNKKTLTKKDREKLISYNKPVLYSKFSKREMISILDSYALKKQTIPERVHATMMSIFGEGVLITGKSGIGKSELALELINRNHLFVGDDAIDIISFAGNPMAKSPKLSRDFIEVRGVGIINVKGMFGIQAMVKEHRVDLIVELVNLDEVKNSIERLGKEYSSRNIAGVEVPLIQIPIALGRTIAPILESAIISFKQRIYDDYIAVNDLTNRLKKD